jgi:hypothetical protein
MAIIIPEYKLIFIMVPATGCTAIGEVLQKRFGAKWFPPEDLYQNNRKVPCKHTSVQQIIRYELIKREELRKHLVFATIRNPFDRLTTLYQRLIGDWSVTDLKPHQENLKNNDMSDLKKGILKNTVENREKVIENAKKIGFDSWLEEYLTGQVKTQKNKSIRQNRMASLLDLLVDPDKMLVLYPLVEGSNKVIRFESLEADLNQLLKDAKIISSDEWIDIPKNNPTQGKKTYQEYYSEKSRSFMEENFSRELAVFGYHFEE